MQARSLLASTCPLTNDPRIVIDKILRINICRRRGNAIQRRGKQHRPIEWSQPASLLDQRERDMFVKGKHDWT